VRYLVDTPCWLWLQSTPEKFSEPVLGVLANPQNELLLSAASVWEIAIKYALGRLALPLPPEEYVPSRMQQSATSPLPVTQLHALRAASLPPHHDDPFDRLLIAQAECENIPIVTLDRAFHAYGIAIQGA
jgi:PIN domain nuclease of toxin-antitoxin system